MDTQTIQSTVRQLQRQAASLLIYRDILSNPIGEAFLSLLNHLRTADEDGIACLRAYGQWFAALSDAQQDWQTYLITQLLQADNAFTRQVQRLPVENLSPALVKAVCHDLQAMQTLYGCTSQQVSGWVQAIAHLDTPPVAWVQSFSPSAHPIWATLQQSNHWADLINELATYHHHCGAGLFAQYHALRWQQHQLVGIAYPDPITLDDLAGYTLQREALIRNTKALLAGYPALHVLLYGSRGSGKSSLVKSLLHEFGDRGLRLVEVAKSELNALPEIADRLRDVPQKFILFVDDLSFEEDDDAYKALKVVLEGNLTARPPNVIVYATSNRRHLIREFFGDRPRPSDADEIHSWDTVQEKLSFSDRFGLTLTFEAADQSTYLTIVHHLAQQAQLAIAPDELEKRALLWATRQNGRSGRTARQFIDALQAELTLS
jgi:predicted AAA+ superfamily ATPase